MIVPPNIQLNFTVFTRDGNNVLTAPSAGPTATVMKEGEVDGSTSVTITNVSTGVYRFSLTPLDSVYAQGNIIEVYNTATVGGNARTELVFRGVVSAQLDAIEELEDQIAASQLSSSGILTSVETKTSEVQQAVISTGVALSVGALAAIISTFENDRDYQRIAGTLMGGVVRNSIVGTLETYTVTPPFGTPFTVTYDSSTGQRTVSS